MTTAPLSPTAASSRRWLFSPLPDLLLGCGLLYAAAFSAQILFGAGMRTLLPYSVFPFMTLVLGAPHYGATLLRAYGTAESRRRYAPFSLWLTLLLGAAFVAAIHDARVGSFIVTLYIAWSPWHYSGQNYGVAMTFLRRRGVPLSPLLTRLVRWSFVLSYLLTLLVLFGPAQAGYAPVSFEGSVFRLLSPGLPGTAVQVSFVLLLGLYVACVAGAAVLLLRRTKARELLPVAVVATTQMLWFAAPTAARYLGFLQGVDPLSPQNAAYTFMWVAAGHFVQYLWITTYYAGVSGRRYGRSVYLGKALLAGSLIWTLPAIVFAPGLLGRLPYDMGLGLLTAAVVNLHHFILDGAIWKLREGRIARVLLLAERPEEVRSAADARLVRWASPLVMGVGAVCLATALLAFFEAEAARRAQDRGDLARVESSLLSVARIGRDSPHQRVALAQLAERRGDRAAAHRHLERGIALFPTVEGWSALAEWHERGGDWKAAAEAWSRAQSLAEDGDAHVAYRLGLARLRAGDLAGARAALRRAVDLAPEAGLPRRSLERVDALLAEQAKAPDGS